MNGELRIEAEPGGIFPQQPRADRMERAGIGRRRLRGGFGRQPPLQQTLHPPVQLRRRAARERREHDALGIGAAEDQMGDAVGEHVGLAGARARDHEQRLRAFGVAGAMLDRQHAARR